MLTLNDYPFDLKLLSLDNLNSLIDEANNKISETLSIINNTIYEDGTEYSELLDAQIDSLRNFIIDCKLIRRDRYEKY